MSHLQRVERKIVSRSDLKIILDGYRKAGKSIGFTNGCFDILHRGHVQYLAQAADTCDILFVGINTDASVKCLDKGSDRPVNNVQARSIVLASLEVVNHVIEFDEDTPLALIELIKPDVLLKGADYDPNQSDPKNPKYIVGRDVVLKNGGQVKAIPLVEGFSTTAIINKLKK
jgi:D-beta-D-heptose 7-phosphate kinase/D-beta-D-heptose 1-phosphate adenosyltransferase